MGPSAGISVAGADEEMGAKGTVCVTGATGFVASWLVKCLLDEGYCVRGAVRDPENKQKSAHLWALKGAQERLQLVQGDLLTEGSYDAAVAGCEGVFHTATSMAIVHTDPKVELIDPAVVGTLNVLNSCAKAKSVRRVVLTSSTAAIRMRADLDNITAPLDDSVWSDLQFCAKYKIWYSIAKALSEKEAWKFAALKSLDLVVVLPGFIVGPSLPTQLSKTVGDVLNLLQGDESFGKHGRMGYVHVDDVARAHILVYEDLSAQGRYICSAEVLNPLEVVEYLAPLYPDLPIPTKLTNMPPMPYYTLDTSKLERLGLKFKPLKTMFDDAIASFKEGGHLQFTAVEKVPEQEKL